MTNVDSQRIKEIRDNTRAMAEAFGRIADALAEALELYVSTQTETQNSNLTFEKRTMRDCYNCKRYETEGECIECHYEPKQTDEPQTTDYCDVCNHKGCDNCVADGNNPYCVPSHYEPKTEPQTDWKDEMWTEAVQTDCTTCDQVGRCERGRAVDCPLTERSE